MQYVHIAGHIGRDPETRYTADGQKDITITVATNIRRGGTDETIWWRATLWGDRWDKMMPYLTKGKPVMIGGDLARKPEIYTDKNGMQQISSLEITADYVKFSPFGKPDQPGQGQGQSGYPQPSSSSNQGAGGFAEQPSQHQYGKNPSQQDSGKKKHNTEDFENFQDSNTEEEELPF